MRARLTELGVRLGRAFDWAPERWPAVIPPRLVMVVVAAGVYVLRQPAIVLSPTVWAEDGTIFFKGAIERGLGPLFDQYNGQIFVPQRIVAFLATALPVAVQPTAYAVVAAVTAVLSCSIILSSRWRFAVPLWARFICLLALLASPVVDEVYGPLDNAHWWLAIGLVLIGMLSDPVGRRLKFGELAFVAVTTLSGFAAVYALPSLAVRAFRNRSAHSRNLLVGALAGVLVQCVYLLTSDRHGSITAVFTDPATNLIVLARRVFAVLFLGNRGLALVWPDRLPAVWVWLVVLVLVAALTAIVWRAPRAETVALVLALVAGWGLALWTVWGVPESMRIFWVAAGRYFLVPTAMIYILLTVAWPKDKLRRSAAALACLLFALGIVRNYHLAPLPSVDWAPFAACVEKGTTTCTTAIPPGWTLDVTPPGR